MSSIAFIPIKSNSKRVENKNFLEYKGKPLFQHLLDKLIQLNAFDKVVVDSDSEYVEKYIEGTKLLYLEREHWLSSDYSNGNDLLWYHYQLFPDYNYYFQLFVTAPNLKPKTITQCVDFLINTNNYDSIFTATEENGWFWFRGQPVNFLPHILPRSQDAKPITKETTGLYGITRNSLKKYKCRVGANPYFYFVGKDESKDIDNFLDFD